MADLASNVRHLDTAHFDSTIDDYSKYITRFETIVSEVNNIINEITSEWKGKGRDAFDKDADMVRANLKDISDIMYEIRNALRDAGSKYIESDEALSKSYES